MTTLQTATTSAAETAGHLRQMKLSEFDRLATLIETAFAEDQTREGRSFRDEMRGVRKMLPLFRLMFAVFPSLENYFYTLVWDGGDRFAAAVTISRQGSDAQRWYIANVATHPDYRGRGLARLLVNAALDRIRTLGGRYALLHVRADNDPAYRLYRSLGFLHLETSTILKGAAQPIAAPALPADYDLRQIDPYDWRVPLAVAQLAASPETRSVCPPTAKRYQESRLGRSLEALLGRAQQVRTRAWAVISGDRPIGLAKCRVHRTGSNPHQMQIEIVPDQSTAALALIAQAIDFCVEQRADTTHPVLINLAAQLPDAIDQLRDGGFTPIETMHELGLKVL